MATNDRISIPPPSLSLSLSLSRLAAIDSIFAGESLSPFATSPPREKGEGRTEERGGCSTGTRQAGQAGLNHVGPKYVYPRNFVWRVNLDTERKQTKATTAELSQKFKFDELEKMTTSSRQLRTKE